MLHLILSQWDEKRVQSPGIFNCATQKLHIFQEYSMFSLSGLQVAFDWRVYFIMSNYKNSIEIQLSVTPWALVRILYAAEKPCRIRYTRSVFQRKLRLLKQVLQLISTKRKSTSFYVLCFPLFFFNNFRRSLAT